MAGCIKQIFKINQILEKREKMGQIKVSKCPIEGLFIIEPAIHGDHRGYSEPHDLHQGKSGRDGQRPQDSQQDRE